MGNKNYYNLINLEHINIAILVSNGIFGYIPVSVLSSDCHRLQEVLARVQIRVVNSIP